LAASLVDSWNSAYFLPRQVELVLVKGKTRYSGPGAGHSERRLLRAIEHTLNEDLDDYTDDSLSDLDDYYSDYSTGSERGGHYSGYGYDTGFGFYGSGSNYRLPGDDKWMTKASHARRKWIERMRQDRKNDKRREKQRREQVTRKKYSLYVMTA
jgi:hypothetical protein